MTGAIRFPGKRRPAPVALVADGHHPFLLHRPRADSALAAHNHPVDPLEIQPGKRADLCLAGKKPHRRPHLAQVVDPFPHRLIFHSRSHPDVLGPAEPHPDYPKTILSVFLHGCQSVTRSSEVSPLHPAPYKPSQVHPPFGTPIRHTRRGRSLPNTSAWLLILLCP